MTDLDKALERLRVEYEAGEDTFLTRLRVDLVWDEEAFTRLTAAMRECCAQLQGQEVIPKWAAELYWFAPPFVRTWTGNDYWKNTLDTDPDHYRAAYELLDRLAEWFFTEVPHSEHA